MSAPELLIDGVDYSCHALYPLTVSRGREHPAESFSPAQLSVVIDGTHAIARGAYVDLTIPAPETDPRWENTPGTWPDVPGTWLDQRRTLALFRGRVTDALTVWDPTAPGEWITRTRLIAVDPVGELVNVPVGDVPWPTETAAARAGRIAALIPWLTWSIDPAAVMVAARDADSTPALELLDRLTQTASAVGGVWFDPGGRVAVWMGDESRPRDAIPTVVLKACDLLPDTEWIEQVGDVVNDATVTYPGPSSSTLEARSTLLVAGDSAGRRHETISTDLVSAVDAQTRADTHTSRYGRPTPRLKRAVLTSRSVTSRAAAEWILKALPTDLVRVEDLPAPAPDAWQGFTEGWNLTLEGPDLWTLDVSLSPQLWSGLFLEWQEAARHVLLSSAAWLKAPGWSFAGYGYGYPGGSIATLHSGLWITWGLPPQAPNDQATQFVGRTVQLRAGRTYKLTIEGTLAAGSRPVRAAFGWTVGSAYSGAAPGPFSLSHTWTCPDDRSMMVGLEAQAGPHGGSATVTAISLTDVTDGDGTLGRWQDLNPAERWFDATAYLDWIQ